MESLQGLPIANMAVRTIAKLLDYDVARVLDCIEGEGMLVPGKCPSEPGPGIPNAKLTEQEYAASLLSSLVIDEDIVSTLLDDNLVPRVVQALTTVSSARAVASLMRVVRYVAMHGYEATVALLGAGAVAQVLTAHSRHHQVPVVVANSMACLATLVASQETVRELERWSVPSGMPTNTAVVGAMGVALHALEANASIPSIAGSSLVFFERVLQFGYDVHTFVGHGVRPVVAAMLGCPGLLWLQSAATSILIHCLRGRRKVHGQSTAELVLATDALTAVMANLQFSIQNSGAEWFAPLPGSPEASLIAGKGAGSGSKMIAWLLTSEEADAVVVSLSLMFFLSSCRRQPSFQAEARRRGCLNAVLAGYSRHHEDPVIRLLFRQLIEVLVNEEEIQHTVSSLHKHIKVLHDEIAKSSEAFVAIDKDADDLVDGHAADEFNRLKLGPQPSVTVAPVMLDGDATQRLTSVARKLVDLLTIIEAVAVSPRFCTVLIQCFAVREVVRMLGTVGAAQVSQFRSDENDGSAAPAMTIDEPRKTSVYNAFGGAGARGRGRGRTSLVGNVKRRATKVMTGGLLAEGIPMDLAEELVARASNTLNNLASIALDVKGQGFQGSMLAGSRATPLLSMLKRFHALVERLVPASGASSAVATPGAGTGAATATTPGSRRRSGTVSKRTGASRILRSPGMSSIRSPSRIFSPGRGGGAGGSAVGGISTVAAGLEHTSLLRESQRLVASLRGVALKAGSSSLERLLSEMKPPGGAALGDEGTEDDEEVEQLPGEKEELIAEVLGRILFQVTVPRVSCRALSARAALEGAAKGGSNLLATLARGRSKAEVEAHVQSLMTSGGVEVCVSFLRSHAALPSLTLLAYVALANMAIAPSGCIGITTRGGSRQILRNIEKAATGGSEAEGDSGKGSSGAKGSSRRESILPSSRGGGGGGRMSVLGGPTGKQGQGGGGEAGPALSTPVLVEQLRILDRCADHEKSADQLKRQGTVRLLILALSATTVNLSLLELNDKRTEPSKGKVRGGKKGGKESKRDEEAIGVGSYNGLDFARSVAEVQALVKSILDKLISPEDVAACAQRLEEFGSNAAITPEYLLEMSVLGQLVQTSAANEVGAVVWNSVGKCIIGSIDAAIKSSQTLIIPPSIATMKHVLRVKASRVEGGIVATEVVPVLIEALECTPAHAGETLDCLAVVAADKAAAEVIVRKGGAKVVRGMLQSMKDASQRAEELVVKSSVGALLALADVPSAIPLLSQEGGRELVTSMMSDMIQDSELKTLGSTLGLLNRLYIHEGKVSGSLKDLLEWITTALTRCGKAEVPEPALLAAAVDSLRLLMKEFAAAGDSADIAAGDVVDVVCMALEVGGCDPRYLQHPQAMTGVLEAIVDSCMAGKVWDAEYAEAARDGIMAVDGPDIVLAAMSSSAASPAVLSAGKKALEALGIKQEGQETLLFDVMAALSQLKADDAQLQSLANSAAPGAVDAVVAPQMSKCAASAENLSERLRALNAGLSSVDELACGIHLKALALAGESIEASLELSKYPDIWEPMLQSASVHTVGNVLGQARGAIMTQGLLISGRLHRTQAVPMTEKSKKAAVLRAKASGQSLEVVEELAAATVGASRGAILDRVASVVARFQQLRSTYNASAAASDQQGEAAPLYEGFQRAIASLVSTVEEEKGAEEAGESKEDAEGSDGSSAPDGFILRQLALKGVVHALCDEARLTRHPILVQLLKDLTTAFNATAKEAATSNNATEDAAVVVAYLLAASVVDMPEVKAPPSFTTTFLASKKNSPALLADNGQMPSPGLQAMAAAVLQALPNAATVLWCALQQCTDAWGASAGSALAQGTSALNPRLPAHLNTVHAVLAMLLQAHPIDLQQCVAPQPCEPDQRTSATACEGIDVPTIPGSQASVEALLKLLQVYAEVIGIGAKPTAAELAVLARVGDADAGGGAQEGGDAMGDNWESDDEDDKEEDGAEEEEVEAKEEVEVKEAEAQVSPTKSVRTVEAEEAGDMSVSSLAFQYARRGVLLGLDLLQRMDVDAEAAAAERLVAPEAQDLLQALFISSHSTEGISLYSLQVLRRAAGLYSPTLLQARAEEGAVMVGSRDRILSAAALQTWTRVSLAVASRVDSHWFVREGIRLLWDLVCTAGWFIGKEPTATLFGLASVSDLRLNAMSMLALQRCSNRWLEDDTMRRQAQDLIAELSLLFVDQSGKGFEE